MVVQNAIFLCDYAPLKHVVTASFKNLSEPYIKILYHFEKAAVELTVLFSCPIKDDDNQNFISTLVSTLGLRNDDTRTPARHIKQLSHFC